MAKRSASQDHFWKDVRLWIVNLKLGYQDDEKTPEDLGSNPSGATHLYKLKREVMTRKCSQNSGFFREFLVYMEVKNLFSYQGDDDDEPQDGGGGDDTGGGDDEGL